MSGNSEGAAAPARIQAELRELVQQLKQLATTKATEGLYRQIVRQGWESELSAEEFHDGLLAAGLKASRASELAAILDHCGACERFLHPQFRLSFRAALGVARGQTGRQAKPAADRLGAIAEALVAGAAGRGIGPYDCGLFRLRFIPAASGAEAPAAAAVPEEAPPTAPDEHLGLPLAPEIEEKLTRLARNSGLSRAKTAVELLQRAPWAALFAALAPVTPGPRPEAPPAPGPRPAELPPQQPATPPPPATFPLHCRKGARGFSLQRRKTSVRTPAYVCRLPVDLPADLAARLTQLGQACGLSRPEIAIWLLAPDPVPRVQSEQAALAQARA